MAMKFFGSLVIFAFCASAVRGVGAETRYCYSCDEDRSPPIVAPTCNKTMSCGELSPYCYARVVRLSNGNIEYSKGCGSTSYNCGDNPRSCREILGDVTKHAEECKVTCCRSGKCNVSWPELNGTSSLVLGVIPMIVSVFFASMAI